VDEGNGRLTDWHLPRVGIQEGAYSEWDAKRFVRQIIQALQFLHEQSIVHRWESELVHVHNVLGKRRCIGVMQRHQAREFAADIERLQKRCDQAG